MGQRGWCLVEQCPFQPVDGTAVADHCGRNANYGPTVERCFIILFAILLEAFGVGVPFAVAGICLHPDATFNFTGYEVLLPANIEAPLATGVEGVFELRLRKFGEADLVEEDVVPVDKTAALLTEGGALHEGGLIVNCYL